MAIIITLAKTLKELEITKNKLATEGKFRVATLHELEKGTAKSITFEMLNNIVETTNKISKKEGKRSISVLDIIDYSPDNEITKDE